MAANDPIPPFPAHLDRDAFGHWFSGFVDGEGCFWLGFASHKVDRYRIPSAQFAIALRADEEPILRQIHSFLGVGLVHRVNPPRTRRNNKPAVRLQCACIPDLLAVIAPHFDRYPLRAKKAADFVIWRQALLLMGAVVSRKMNEPGRRMFRPKWRPEEVAAFAAYSDALREQRKYVAPPTVAI